MSTTEGAAKAAEKLQALRERAKYLLEIGYGVIQTGKDGDPKRPLKVGWNLNFARKPETIDGWEWPNVEGAGIAIVPEGRVVAIDIDAPNKEGGPDASLTEMYFNELNTTFSLLVHAWKEKTPNGGYHIVVRAAPDIPISKLATQATGKFGVKIELKCDRRYSLVVAPTEVKGIPYETKHGPVPVTALPEMGKEFFEHLGLLPQPKAPPKKRVDGEGVGASFANSLLHEARQVVETAVKGNRNNSVNKAFFYLGRLKAILGDRFEEVYAELYNRCKEKLVGPDFPESELRRTAKSGLQAGELEPLDPQKEVFLITPRDLAAIVLRERGDDIVYIEGIGWHVWNGRYWQRMPKERGIAAIIDEVLIEKYKVWREAADPTDEDYIKWLKKIGRAIGDPDYLEKIQRAILKVNVDGKSRFIPQENIPKPEEKGHLLAVANGVLDLRTGELHPHVQFKSKYLFWGLETPYNPNARAPHFEAAMRTWGAGDAEWVDYMQWVLGSFLTGDVSAQKMFIFYGHTANGKSTLIRIVAEILENYAELAPWDLFKKHKKDTHPSMYMTLFDKRMVYRPDFPEKTPLDEELIKSQTGDPISGRYMREDYVKFDPTHKAVIATNDLPKITGSEEAVFRRVVPIPFRVTFNKSRRLDPHFLEKLRREKPGILRWLVEGAKMYLNDPKREPPKSIGNLWEAYQRREDPVASFVAACIEAAPGEGVTRADVYQAFERYWEYRFGKGVKPPTPNSFTIKFKKVAAPEEGFVNGGRGYLNIRVRPVWEDLDEKILLEEKNADELPATLFSVPKEPELPLYIEETAKAGERLEELLAALSQSEVKPLRRLSLYLRGLHALTYAEIGTYNGAIMYLGGTPKHTTPTPKETLGVLQQVIRDIEGSLNGEEVALAPLPIPPQSGGRTALPTPPTPEMAERYRVIEEIRRAIRELERAIKGDDPTDPDPTPTDPGPTPPSPIGTDPTPNLPPREGEPKWEYVTDASQLPEIEERLQREDAVGWDLETVAHPGVKDGALHPATGRARLFTLYLPTENTAYIIDLDGVPEAWRLLAKAKKIVGHNLIFDLSFAAANGAYIAHPKERLWDTKIAEKLLDCKEYSEPHRNSLKEVAAKVGIRLNKEYQTADWDGELTDDMLHYAAMDAYAAYRVYLSQRERIAGAGLGRAMAIEMGALPAIAAMRAWGVGVDRDALEKAWEASKAEMERLEKELEPYGREVEPSLNVGERLNWNRLELIKKVLHRHGIQVESTSEEALAPHKNHPFVAALLRWREAKKRKELLADLRTPLKADGRIYADWKPLGAGTGRMTCKTPNLQQTPHELRTYIKPRAGCVLVKADFSQIELRIAAALAKDRRMLQAFREGTDLHRLTASLILSKSLKQVSKEERQLAKALNFGLLYGMGAKGLKAYAESEYGVSLPLERAKEYREKFFATYPGLAKWHRDTGRTLREAKSRGEGGIVVETLAGRKRWVEGLTAALNTPIQGTGADGLKSAVAVYYKWLLERGLWGEVRIVLLVHDEVVVEAPEPLAIVASHLLTEAMRKGMEAAMRKGMEAKVKGVPIGVEAGIYSDWGQTLHPLNEAWERFAKIPKGHPVREAILKGEDPDPERDGEYLTDHMIIRAILNGETIETPF